MPDQYPVASLEVLKRDGMDLSKFGSCSERVKQGTKTTNLGCPHHAYCQWANEPVPEMERKVGDETETVPGGLRPRNKKYVIVLTGDDGRRRVRESWCACYEWHDNFSKKHNRNGMVVRVTGGEGDSVTMRGSKKIPASGPGTEPSWQAVFWKDKVPPFKPGIADEMVTEAYAAEVIRDSGILDEQNATKAALGMAEAADVELDDEQIKNLIDR